MAAADHRIHRHPAAPWVELRQSAQTRDCYRPHTHAEYAIGLVDAGQATLLHDDGPHAVRAGSVVLIAPGTVHACNPSTAQPWSYRMLFVEARWLHSAMAQRWALADPPARLAFAGPALRDAALAAALDRLCQPITGAAQAQAWAALLADALAPVARPAAAAGPQRRWPDLAPALQAMATQPDARLTVAALAQDCGMSTGHFIRRFKAALQLTPGQYLQNLRVQGARRLLAQGVALADAAQAMGFADQAHLQRAFKAHHAMTPGRYATSAAMGAPEPAAARG